MTDERRPEEATDKVEDLDVPSDEEENVKGGIKDGTSNTLMYGERAARGKHFPEADITL